MSLEAHMNELVTLVKAVGRRYPDIRSRVGPKLIFMLDGTLPVEEGDHIERILPNTLIETFIVDERGFGVHPLWWTVEDLGFTPHLT